MEENTSSPLPLPTDLLTTAQGADAPSPSLGAPQPDSDSNALDCSSLGNIQPDDLVAEITPSECENLGASNGLDGTSKTNCADLSEMVCLIKQCVDAITANKAMVIATNDESKCQDDNDPTHASMWSRALRFFQAVTCILCEYDPFVATILKSGRYPQILMGAVQTGADGTGYPQWVNPDETPTEGSAKPVTSKGVITAVNEAILSVWHLWEEYPNFAYFAQTYDNPSNPQNLVNQSNNQTPSWGDTALVADNGTDKNVLYTYGANGWEVTKVLGDSDKLTNFAVTHIEKGYYAGKGVYYFHDGANSTWQVMDVDLTGIEDRVEVLEEMYARAVLGTDPGKQYVLTTAADLSAADSVPCDNDKETIVLITG